jgi:hypothetical protein
MIKQQSEGTPQQPAKVPDDAQPAWQEVLLLLLLLLCGSATSGGA